MKTKYTIISFLLLFTISCSDDLLNPSPTASLSDNDVITDVVAAKTALMGAYALTGDYRYLTIYNISSDVMGQDLTMSSGAFSFPTYNWIIYSYQYQQVPSDNPWWTGYCAYIWRYAYKAIDQANTIIANAETIKPEGAEKEDIIAQAYGVRAYNFLVLTQLFSRAYNDQPDSKGIILRLIPGSTDEASNLPRATVRQSYERIIEDLTYVYEHGTATDVQYINKKGAALLLARVYLSINDYTNAEKYASIALDNTYDGSNLMSQDEYRSGFKDHNQEWLWYFNFNANTSNLYASIPSFYWLCKQFKGYAYGDKINPDDVLNADIAEELLDGYSTVRASFSFRNMFEDADCRKLFPGYLSEDDGFFIAKFGHRSRIGDAEFPFCRVAEGYLIKAEAELYRQGGSSALAKEVLNKLQIARGATPTAATPTIDDIWKERRKELYGEGFAIHDIKRLQKPLQRTGNDQWADVKTLSANSERFMFPIPNTELLYNKALTAADQNEYWQ
ncbi:MAG: RagB/SusD family nutrient uptake outer membrane protein [Prevotellaceae bacterium]|nr:RagB/SusD family nutrient uptake outer membrane protein [Prevotellaceae bacterium]